MQNESYEQKIEFVFVKRLPESWTAIERCLLRAQHVYRDGRTCSVIEDLALPVQTASYGELRRLSKWHVKYSRTCCVIVGHVCTVAGRHDMGLQAVVCNRIA